jgi:hypothetical protein
MARDGVFLVAMTAVFWSVLVAAPAMAGRGRLVSFAIRAWCIPKTESLLLEHGARRECAYDLRSGDRAVGVGYNLDDDGKTRRVELATVLADYEKVRDSRDCNKEKEKTEFRM